MSPENNRWGMETIGSQNTENVNTEQAKTQKKQRPWICLLQPLGPNDTQFKKFKSLSIRG